MNKKANKKLRIGHDQADDRIPATPRRSLARAIGGRDLTVSLKRRSGALQSLAFSSAALEAGGVSMPMPSFKPNGSDPSGEPQGDALPEGSGKQSLRFTGGGMTIGGGLAQAGLLSHRSAVPSPCSSRKGIRVGEAGKGLMLSILGVGAKSDCARCRFMAAASRMRRRLPRMCTPDAGGKALDDCRRNANNFSKCRTQQPSGS